MGAFFRGLAVVLGCLLIPVVFLLCFVIVDLLMTQQQVCPGIALLFINALLGWTAFRLIACRHAPRPRRRVEAEVEIDDEDYGEPNQAFDDHEFKDEEDWDNDRDDEEPEECYGFKTKVVGVSRTQAAVRRLKRDQPLQLVREPSNPADPNAVSVRTLDGKHIGYLSRFRAQLISDSIRQFGSTYRARVLQVTGRDQDMCGVNISVTAD